MYVDDWIMRQIAVMSRMLAYLLFIKKGESDLAAAAEDASAPSATALLRDRLDGLLDQGRVCDAEDLLFEELERLPSLGRLSAALDFYRSLAGREDSWLEARDFSREEIGEGLAALERMILPFSPAPF